MENAVMPMATFQKLSEPKPEVDEKDLEQQQIALLANDPRWLEVEKVIDLLIDRLNNLTDTPEAATVEEIGFSFLANKIAVTHLKAIRDLPRQVAEGLEDTNGESK